MLFFRSQFDSDVAFRVLLFVMLLLLHIHSRSLRASEASIAFGLKVTTLAGSGFDFGRCLIFLEKTEFLLSFIFITIKGFSVEILQKRSVLQKSVKGLSSLKKLR